MRHIHVATNDDRLLLVELLKIGLKIIFPTHAVVKAPKFFLRIRCVDRNKIEIVHLHRDDTPLVVVLINPDAIRYVQRLSARKDSCSAIALFIGIIPIRLITIEVQIQLSGLHLRLLKAEEIGIKLTENVTKTLTLTSPKAIHIPRNKLYHRKNK